MKAYLVRILDGLSRLFNTILYPKTGTPSQSISSAAYHFRRYRTMRFIDWLFSRIERHHCERSYRSEVERAGRFYSEARR